MKYHRIFVEWSDPQDPDKGAYVSSLNPDFQAELVALVERYGPPTLVEFRAHGEGWEPGGGLDPS